MTEEELWHKCHHPIIPRRTIDGTWTILPGQVWRRRVNGKWQYKQDEETEEEMSYRLW